MTNARTAGETVWPGVLDYNEAVQHPSLCFQDEELRRCTPLTTPLGLPCAWTGGFAAVYQLRSSEGPVWAVKCFTSAADNRHRRYQAISDHLRQAGLKFTIDFQYQEQGIRIHGRWYPILKMRWVEGDTLVEFVRKHLDRPAILGVLCEMWVRIAADLRGARMAHGDLQHGNVLLVASGQGKVRLRLIDYDGMWVPALAESPSGEAGHRHYQHPRRLLDRIYDGEVDRFSHLVIYAGLRCLVKGHGDLWLPDAERLLFGEEDFLRPEGSQVLRTLWERGDAEVRALVGHLVLATRIPAQRVPLLEEVVSGGPALKPAEETAVGRILGAGTPIVPVTPVQTGPSMTRVMPPLPTSRTTATVPVAGVVPSAVDAESSVKQPARPTRRTRLATQERQWLLGMGIAAGSMMAMMLAVVVGVTLRRGDKPKEPPVAVKVPRGAVPPEQPAIVHLSGPATVELTPGKAGPLRIAFDWQGSPGPVRLVVANLPRGVRADPVEVREGQREAELVFVAEPGIAAGTPSALMVRALAGDKAIGEHRVELKFLEVPRVATNEIVNSIGMKLVRIPAGKFLMGSPKEEAGRSDSEGPQHEVEISRAFYMGVYEVTQGQYEKVTGNNPSYYSRTGVGKDKVAGLDTTDFPVERVRWGEAVDFCAIMDLLDKKKPVGWSYRLPTEAEWEQGRRSPDYADCAD